MTSNENGILAQWAITFALGNLLEYALFHVSNMFRYDTLGTVFSYARYYLSRIWEFAMPALAVLMMLVIFAYIGKKQAFVAGAVWASTRILYYFPLGYITSIGYGYDSIEAVLIALAVSVIIAALTYIELIICFGLSMLVISKMTATRRGTLCEVMAAGLTRHDALDLGNIGTAAIGVIVLCQFIKVMVLEIVDTVGFFLEYGSTYSIGELLYIMLKYIFALLLLVMVHLFVCFIKKKVVDGRTRGEKND